MHTRDTRSLLSRPEPPPSQEQHQSPACKIPGLHAKGGTWHCPCTTLLALPEENTDKSIQDSNWPLKNDTHRFGSFQSLRGTSASFLHFRKCLLGEKLKTSLANTMSWAGQFQNCEENRQRKLTFTEHLWDTQLCAGVL